MPQAAGKCRLSWGTYTSTLALEKKLTAMGRATQMTYCRNETFASRLHGATNKIAWY